MKEITINLLGIGNIKGNGIKIIIYDSNSYIVCKKIIYNNKLNICLKQNQIYIIEVEYFDWTINKSFIVLNNICNYYFKFNQSIICNNNSGRNITFLLTDYNYSNLPIERGNLILNG